MARVGLLEDNNRISKLCATMLNYAGHEVSIYDCPLQCLKALSIPHPTFEQIPAVCNVAEGYLDEITEAIKASPMLPLPIDVLILDLHLPMMPGLEVLRLLRSSPRTCVLPLVFCTAAAKAEIMQARTLAPEAALVEKPFRLQTLIAAISEVLSEHS
jgi:CheY-like chemotaxis protein